MKISSEDRAWIDSALHAIAAVESGPSEADIANAPVIAHWKPAISPFGHVILLGEIVDQPNLDKTSLTTSKLIAIHPEAGWARTVLCWYRLAQPVAATEEALARSLGLKNPTAASLKFAMPGFITMDDMANLDEILTENIVRIRKIDAADRAASAREA